MLDNYTFENYVEDETNPNKSILVKLLNENFEGIDMVIINSSQGNGGTHLLEATCHALKILGKKTLCLSTESYLRQMKNAEPLIEVDYYFFDDFMQLFYKNSSLRKNFYKKVVAEIKQFIGNGKKVFISLADTEPNDKKPFTNQFKNIIEVNSNYPSQLIRKKIIAQEFQENNWKGSNDLFEKLSLIEFDNIRVLKGIIYSSYFFTVTHKKAIAIDEKKFYRKVKWFMKQIEKQVEELILKNRKK